MRRFFLLAALAGLMLGGCHDHQAQVRGRAALDAARREVDQGALVLRVKTVLAASQPLRGSHIDAHLQGRDLYLTGSVSSPRQKATADRIAHDTLGTSGDVVDELVVEKQAARAR